jgi:glyoxylase-like metal-dependent hydrolase (beta-lactamase superfamily II)
VLDTHHPGPDHSVPDVVSHGRERTLQSVIENNASDTTGRLYFRQLLSGRDFAQGDQLAAQMVNFVYAIGDRETGECVLVDPAYSPAELVDVVAADDMTVTGVLATHYHADHVGGSMMGFDIDGIAALLDKVDCPIHIQADEVEWVRKTTHVSPEHLVAHGSGDVLRVGEIDITLMHTPGHTPGSQCFLVDGKLVAGDTLFLDGCGRTDLPGSDASQMIRSLTRLSKVPGDTILYPGHQYSAAPSATMEHVLKHNYIMQGI